MNMIVKIQCHFECASNLTFIFYKLIDNKPAMIVHQNVLHVRDYRKDNQ